MRAVTFIRILLIQIFYITPIFWFMELVQNNIYYFFSRQDPKVWGWWYPASPYHWFYFKSLTLWAGSVALFWGLYYFVRLVLRG